MKWQQTRRHVNRRPCSLKQAANRIDEKCDETEKEHKIWEAAAEERQKRAEMMEGRLTDLGLEDRLIEMKNRCFGLQAAISFVAGYGDIIEGGVAQLATDVAHEMEDLAEEFEAERKLRMAEEKSEASEDKMPGA